jgi:hypothetical protein
LFGERKRQQRASVQSAVRSAIFVEAMKRLNARGKSDRVDDRANVAADDK